MSWHIDHRLLIPVVERLLDRRGITLLDWSVSRVPYTTFLPGRTLLSLSGTAAKSDERIPFRLVLKIFGPPTGEQAEPSADLSWAREAEAYRSGLLDRLPGDLRAPRAVQIAPDADGAVWLWLEHVADVYDRRWPISAFGLAARHLGQFNGAYLTERAIPPYPWLTAGWTEGDSEPAAVGTARSVLERLLADPRVRATFPDRIDVRARRLLRDQSRFRTILGELPQTLCHHDASSANLFARRRPDGQIETVAIDWESIGPGALGADLATLVFGTLRRGDVSSAEAAELEQVALAGYLVGLRDASWQGPADQARQGYLVATALRWSLLVGTLRSVVDDAARVRAARDWGYSSEALLRQWVPLSSFLLDRADQAHRLARSTDATS